MNKRETDSHSYKMLISIFAMLLMFSCTPTQEEVDELVTVPGADLPTLPNLDVACYQDVYAPKEEDITRNIDIIIIPDTSGSIKQERAQIAQGFDSFLDILPSEANVNVAVMLGHGSNSSHFGQLYSKGIEPKILSNQDLSVDEIKAHLRTKMENPATDNQTDGGEAGLASLNRSLDDDRFLELQAQGFYREDAALVVIFVADEQDICAIYPDGVTPVRDPQGKEDSSRITECFTDGVQTLTPNSVLTKLRSKYDGRPLVTGGVLYNNSATIPYGGENEIGYGYQEMIELGGGFSVDMATGEYGNGLAKLGILAMTRIDPVNDFNLQVTNIDTSTIKSFVDGQEVTATYDGELNIVSLTQDVIDSRGPFSVAAVQYCEKPKVTKQVLQIAAGGNHSCALLASGDVKCWGDNTHGQLGYGNTDNLGDDEGIDSVASLELGQRALQVIAGQNHTCVLLESNDVKCFGQNTYGQLGLGHTDSMGDDESLSDYPNTVLGSTVRKLYGGTTHNCALLTNGDVKCWGSNVYGQLGTGDSENYGDNELASAAPTVNLGARAIQMDLSSLSFHACAILDGGELKCWGRNMFGQLGTGSVETVVRTAETANTIKPVISVTTGALHTCAILSDNTVQCFGDNRLGQLGELLVDGENYALPDLGFDVHKVYAGNLTTCALSAAGEAKCWGQGAFGKLGQEDTASITTDLANISSINLGLEVSEVVGGLNHHCFLSSDAGLVKCIGNGSNGQLGNGNTDSVGDDESPSSISFLELFKI